MAVIKKGNCRKKKSFCSLPVKVLVVNSTYDAGGFHYLAHGRPAELLGWGGLRFSQNSGRGGSLLLNLF